MYKKGRVNSNSRIISTDEDPSLRIESSAIINLRGVSTKLSKYNTKYVIPRCKTTTYQQSFIIRACRLWNALVDELNFDTDNISYFKRILLSYYHNSLTLNYDSENPRTFKSICLKCNLVRSLEKPILCCY